MSATKSPSMSWKKYQSLPCKIFMRHMKFWSNVQHFLSRGCKHTSGSRVTTISSLLNYWRNSSTGLPGGTAAQRCLGFVSVICSFEQNAPRLREFVIICPALIKSFLNVNSRIGLISPDGPKSLAWYGGTHGVVSSYSFVIKKYSFGVVSKKSLHTVLW